MTTPDLFGGEPDKERGKHYIQPRGYYGPPGRGPAGETCGTCEHVVGRGGRYLKCAKARSKWTHGRATDILSGMAACVGWQQLGKTSVNKGEG